MQQFDASDTLCRETILGMEYAPRSVPIEVDGRKAFTILGQSALKFEEAILAAKLEKPRIVVTPPGPKARELLEKARGPQVAEHGAEPPPSGP